MHAPCHIPKTKTNRRLHTEWPIGKLINCHDEKFGYLNEIEDWKSNRWSNKRNKDDSGGGGSSSSGHNDNNTLIRRRRLRRLKFVHVRCVCVWVRMNNWHREWNQTRVTEKQKRRMGCGEGNSHYNMRMCKFSQPFGYFHRKLMVYFRYASFKSALNLVRHLWRKITWP